MRRTLTVVMASILLLGAAVDAAAVSESLWVPRGTETYNLEAGESVQFRIEFDELQVRAWILEVDGDQRLCDVNVLYIDDEKLLYQQHDESRHRLRVPWGRDEEVVVTITADTRIGGVYTVKFLAPPPESAGRAFWPVVNRALEALEDGNSRRAESLLHDAIKHGRDVGVASMLLAGLYRERGEPERAAAMLRQALDDPLPPELRDVRAELERQLETVRNPLTPAMIGIDRAVAESDDATAARLCDDALDAVTTENAWELSELHRRRGRIHRAAGELVPAQEHLDLALANARSTRQRALTFYRLGLLQRDLGNPHQGRQALRVARELGLPPELDAEAAAQLAALDAAE